MAPKLAGGLVLALISAAILSLYLATQHAAEQVPSVAAEALRAPMPPSVTAPVPSADAAPARAPTPDPPPLPAASAQSRAPEAAARPELTAPSPSTPRRPMLALVIDDLGWDASAGNRVLALPTPVTVAVLPGTPAGRRLAQRAAGMGHEVILHQPMEALDARYAGPGAMTAAHGAAELSAILDANLADVPHRVGISNHMGSRLTAETGAMTAVMSALAAHGLYFLDSRTTPDTVALRTARAHRIPATRRDVFLDAVLERAVIERALDEALELAENQGHALAIGHPHAATMAVLEFRMAEILDRVELVPVSTLIARRTIRAPVRPVFTAAAQ